MKDKQTASRDEELAEAARSGERPAMDQLVERYFGMVYAIAYARLGHRESAEDLAQEVFLRVYLAIGDLRNPKHFSAWITQIARNLAYQWSCEGRRVSGVVAMVPWDDGVAEKVADMTSRDARQQAEAKEQNQALNAAIFRLPVEQRELVLMRYSEGIGVADIAARLGVHQTTIRRQLDKALAQLKRSIEPILGEATSGLGTRPRAVARTVGLIGAAALLSAPAKSALAATVANTAGLAVAALPGAGGLASQSGLSGLLSILGAAGANCLPTALTTGGQIMGAKAAVVAMAGIGIALGCVHYARIADAGQKAAANKSNIQEKAMETENLPVGMMKLEPANGAPGNSFSFMNGKFEGEGIRLDTIVMLAWKTSPARIKMSHSMALQIYDASINLQPDQKDLLQPTIQKVLQDRLGLSVRKENQETDVYMLTAPKGQSAGLRTPSGEGYTMSNNNFGQKCRTQEICSLVIGLESHLGKPVINETNLKGNYDWDLTCNMKDPADATKALREQLGIEMTPAKRTTEMLVVEKEE